MAKVQAINARYKGEFIGVFRGLVWFEAIILRTTGWNYMCFTRNLGKKAYKIQGGPKEL